MEFIIVFTKKNMLFDSENRFCWMFKKNISVFELAALILNSNSHKNCKQK